MYDYKIIIHIHVLLVLFLSQFFGEEETTCIHVNKDTGESRCCVDYRNVSGRCEPCYGTYGINCTHQCVKGFYGHGCRNSCSCASYQRCHIIHGCMDETKCINNSTDKIECCADYYGMDSDSCEPCVGYFGKNCSTPCSFGYYGHGCRKKCNCSSDTHWCDAKSGCKKKDTYNSEDDSSEAICDNHNALKRYLLVLTAVGSIGVTSAIWIIGGLFCKWYAINIQNEQTYNSSNELPNTVPENQSPTTSMIFYRMDRSTEPTKHVHSTKLQQSSRKNLRGSQSPFDGNSRFNRYSDDYNHLDFHKKTNSFPRLNTYSNQNYSKLEIMAPHLCKNTNHEDLEEERTYVFIVLEDTLSVSGSNSMQIQQEDVDKQKEPGCIKSENESRSNEDQNNTVLPTYCNVDKTHSDTGNSNIDIQDNSLDSTDCKMDLNEKD